MSHGADDRDFTLVDRPCNDRLIERPKILHAAAAPANDEHIRGLFAVHRPNARSDLLRGAVSLYTHRAKAQMHVGKAPPDNLHHVLQRSAGPRSHHAYAAR